VTAVLVSGLVAVFAPLAVHILLGEQYQGSAAVLRLLAIATIPAIVNQICAVSLQSLGHDRAVAGMVSGAVLVQLVLVCVLASAHGALGAGVALLIMQCTLMLALLAYIAVVRRAAPRPVQPVAALQGAAAGAGQSSAERADR
jgi:O-antigen/teichoic acid export membrane protein